MAISSPHSLTISVSPKTRLPPSSLLPLDFTHEAGSFFTGVYQIDEMRRQFLAFDDSLLPSVLS
jgi:hypothetical protein